MSGASRPAKALGRVSFRFGFFFLVFSGVQWPILYSGLFGSTPVIPSVFLVCVDVILLFASSALALSATLASFKPLHFSWRALCGVCFTLTAGWISFIALYGILNSN